MQHETFPDTDTLGDDPGVGLTAQTRAGLDGIVTRLDSHFMPAGLTLARLVETVGTVLAGLDAVGGALGEDGREDGRDDAAEDLLAAASRLRDAPARQENRSAQIASLTGIMQQLAGLSEEIARILTVLQFYTVNLKIAAAGADEFVEFATDMSLKLTAGSQELDAFKKQIAVMQRSLGEMRNVDLVLARECARVIPAVPDRLMEDVGRMRAQQADIARVSQTTRAIVLRLQQKIGIALGAIQIGDITRQRLEHVLAACWVFDAAMADPAMVDPAGTRGHMLRLFSDQMSDIAQDFRAETGQLLDALGGLAPDCDALLGQGRGASTIEQSGHFLRNMSSCIAGAQGMTTQLQLADNKAAEIAEVVLGVAQSLRERVQVIEGLRFDVDYMAINVNIRARRDAQIGRPVAVIADEIRVCSQQLAELTLSITEVADRLGQVSDDFDAGRHGAEVGVNDALAGALLVIQTGAQRAETAMAGLDGNAQDIVAMIRDATGELSVCSVLSESLRDMTGDLADLAGHGAAAVSDNGLHPVVGQMDTMARTYTMASERVIHDRHLLPGMAPISKGSVANATPPSDDDLFDEALF